MSINYPIHVYYQSIINIGLPLGLGIFIFLFFFLAFFAQESKTLFKHYPICLYVLLTIGITSLTIAYIQQSIKSQNRISEHHYYYHTLVIYEKGNAATPLEKDAYNTAIDKLTVFQTEHPQCLTGYYDWSSQPHMED